MTENPHVPTGIPERRPLLQGRQRADVPRTPAEIEAFLRIPSSYAWLFAAGVAALMAYYACFNPNQKTPATLLLSSLVLAVSCAPMAIFLARGKIFQVPALEAHGLFYATSFGFAGFLPIMGTTSIGTVTEDKLDKALICTLVGLLSLFFGYYVVGRKLLSGFKPIQASRGLPPQSFEWLAWMLCLVGGAATWVGRAISFTAFSQVSGALYSMGFFLLMVLAFEKRVSFLTGFLVIVLVLPGEIFFNSGLNNGQLAGVVCLVCWMSLVILRCWRRIPFLLLIIGFMFFLIFQPVKSYVRTLAWVDGIQLGPIQTVEAYAEGFKETYGNTSGLISNRKQNFDESFDRINHLVTTAAIIRDTPSSQPFAMGQTYLPLLTKLIPRALWKGKPMETTGNDWAVRYGFLGENDKSTSFNLPWLPEMFMNFGWWGVVGVMFLLGLVYRLLWNWLMGQSKSPVEYAVAICFAQNMVFAESNLSLQLGEVIIFAVLLWVLFKFLQFVGMADEVADGPVFPPRPARLHRLKQPTVL